MKLTLASYLMLVPLSLEQRRIETSRQYRREKLNEYAKKSKSKRKVVQQLLAKQAD